MTTIARGLNALSCAAVVACLACSASDGSSSGAGSQASGGASHGNHPDPKASELAPPPVLSHAVVDLAGDFDEETGAFGALRCRPRLASDKDGDVSAATCVLPFDAGTAGEGLAGSLSFVTVAGATAFAATSGVVTDLIEQGGAGSGVYQVRARLGAASPFWLEYTEVLDPVVAVGDVLEAGAVLGTAAPYGEGLARVGVAVIRDESAYQLLCPARYADAALAERLEAARAASGVAELCTTTSLTCSETPCADSSAFHELGGDVDQGRAIYQQTCASCHGKTGQSMHGCDPFCWHDAVSSKIVGYEMPPQGEKCVGSCADDVAAYLLHELFPNHQH